MFRINPLQTPSICQSPEEVTRDILPGRLWEAPGTGSTPLLLRELVQGPRGFGTEEAPGHGGGHRGTVSEAWFPRSISERGGAGIM